ncbi:hypothetical protein PROFUN_16384 [Planoprotostelium fungivorum]|uniref:Uncharacterized protein n=1 Tax=Planoprotostelium fungivorum TaxID=1890364 RepID=A0A2P6MQP6_9EUKA|nr:hypothetical protein PROFUN_16384 [Planoprotostelium fungivorum]
MENAGDTGLFPRGKLNLTLLGLKEMCGNRNLGVQGNSTTLLKRLRDWSHNEEEWISWNNPSIESEDVGVKLVEPATLDSVYRSLTRIADRAFELLSEWERELPPGCFNFIMESLGRENMMLFSRGCYEDMLHQIEPQSILVSRPVLIRDSNVILPVKERLKDDQMFSASIMAWTAAFTSSNIPLYSFDRNDTLPWSIEGRLVIFVGNPFCIGLLPCIQSLIVRITEFIEEIRNPKCLPRVTLFNVYCAHHSGVTDSNSRSMTPST